MYKIRIASAFLLFLAACATAVKMESPNLKPIGAGRNIVSPPGLMANPADEAAFEHLSQGSDVFPYEWIKALQSTTYAGTPFLSDLEKKFGILPETVEGKYLLPYSGIAASWSNHPPEISDALKKEELEKVRVINGIKSIKMVGVNCALCHSSKITYQGVAYHVDGAPNMANVRGYFKDMAQSTIATLFNETVLEKFLTYLQVPDPAKESGKLHKYFCKELKKQIGKGKSMSCSKVISALIKARFQNKDQLLRWSLALGSTLEKLLRLTYGFSDTDNIGELKARMLFFGRLMVGTDPNNAETVLGTAPVSLPWIWGTKHMALFNYAADTNSVLTRNMGKALGLGALNGTVNVYNLDRLERLIHKIKVPRWQEYFPEDQSPIPAVEEMALAGKAIYDQKCAECHTAKPVRAGPQKTLYSYNIIPQKIIKTDSKALEKKLSSGIDRAIENVKRNYYSTHKFTDDMIADYEFFELRGKETFKDSATLSGYKARYLAGVWVTAPYLHNGSVPTIRDLLSPPEKRPIVFNIGSRELDPVDMGFQNPERPSVSGNPLSPIPCGKTEDTCVDTRKEGNRNTGHEYGTDLSYTQQSELIEYLKILPTEVYYE